MGSGGFGALYIMHFNTPFYIAHSQDEFLSQSYYVNLFLQIEKSIASHLLLIHSQVLLPVQKLELDCLLPQGTGSHEPIAWELSSKDGLYPAIVLSYCY